MCTLNIRFENQADYPVVVIANRDEFYARPSVPPSVISEDPAIFAPTDLEAGGTWFGVNQWGLAGAITNVWLIPPGESEGPSVHATRSRGLLTLDVLRCRKPEQVSDFVQEAVRDHVYDFFNLLVANREGATVFSYTGVLREYSLLEGTAAILNTQFSPDGQEDEVLPPLSRDDKRTGKWLAEVRRLLARHPEICRHGSRFGTRSSQVVALGGPPKSHNESHVPGRFWYGDGPPCETQFADLSSEVQSVLNRGSSVKTGAP